MENEYNDVKGDMAYPYPIHRNALPHCDVFMDNGYTKEEMKLVNETHKILGDDSIGVTATAIRIPVVGGHSESINIQLKCQFELNDVRKLLHESPGIVLQDKTEIEIFEKYHELIDSILVLAIKKPGFSGQKFEMKALELISLINNHKYRKKISLNVDGGVSANNIFLLKSENVVSGSYVLNSDDPKKNIMILQTSSQYEQV